MTVPTRPGVLVASDRPFSLFTHSCNERDAGVVSKTGRQAGQAVAGGRRPQSQRRPGDRLGAEQSRVRGRLEVSGRRSDEPAAKMFHMVNHRGNETRAAGHYLVVDIPNGTKRTSRKSRLTS